MPRIGVIADTTVSCARGAPRARGRRPDRPRRRRRRPECWSPPRGGSVVAARQQRSWRWARALAETEVVERGGRALYVLHDLHELDLDPAPPASTRHRRPLAPSARRAARRRALSDPGSAGPRRFRLPVSVGGASRSTRTGSRRDPHARCLTRRPLDRYQRRSCGGVDRPQPAHEHGYYLVVSTTRRRVLRLRSGSTPRTVPRAQDHHLLPGARTDYHREVRAGDPLRSRRGCSLTTTSASIISTRCTTRRGWLAATNELLSLTVSRATRRAAAMAPEILARLPRSARPRRAATPPQAGRAIGLATPELGLVVKSLAAPTPSLCSRPTNKNGISTRGARPHPAV